MFDMFQRKKRIGGIKGRQTLACIPYHVGVVDGLDLVDIITVDACIKHAVQ